MQPTTSGRFRVHDRRERPDGDGAEFVLVEVPDGPVDPSDPNAADAFDPLYVAADGYADAETDADASDEALADAVAALDPGNVVSATLAWDDGTARFADVTVLKESRFRFEDDVKGMFEAAVDGWEEMQAAGEAMSATTTRAQDGEPNGALYLFADAPGRDTFAELRAGTIPIEPLVARVNARRADNRPREVFVLRPEAYDFVAVYVVFDREGVLASTVRDTYDIGLGLAEGLELQGGTVGESAVDETSDEGDGDDDDAPGDGVDLQDRL